MVYYSQQSQKDLNGIFSGLITWKKMTLNYNHVVDYHNTIVNICDNLDRTSHHALCTFPLHKRFGKYVHHYRRSKNTTWYIIYNRDKHNNIFIQHIISNHITTADAE